MVRSVCDVDAGIAALTRDGLGDFGCENPEWQVAIETLRRAKVDPTSENVDAARRALKLVALQTGALLDG